MADATVAFAQLLQFLGSFDASQSPDRPFVP